MRAIPEEGHHQLRLAHELVAIAHRREGAINRVWTERPVVGDAQHELGQAETALDQLLEQASEQRMRRREREISRELCEQIKPARRARRDGKQRERAAKADAYASVAPALHLARNTERAERKAPYREFVQHQGLYWATDNAVARSHDTAARRFTQIRKEGRSAELHHHRYEETGRIAVQLQRESRSRPAHRRCSPRPTVRGAVCLLPRRRRE